MLQIAIKGHATRGKEVIEILEMLGGKNDFKADGTITNRYYYIDDSNNKIYHCLSINPKYAVVFSLEQFLEKYPYKVGDKVKITDDNTQWYILTSMKWNREKILYDGVSYNGNSKLNKYTAEKLYSYIEQKEESMEELKETNGKELLYVCQRTGEIIKKEMIKKACEWISQAYTNGVLDWKNCDAIIDNFRKAMEE